MSYQFPTNTEIPRVVPPINSSQFDHFREIRITMATTTMKALNYLGPYQVRVEDVEKPKMEHPDDVIVKVTTVSDAKPPITW